MHLGRSEDHPPRANLHPLRRTQLAARHRGVTFEGMAGRPGLRKLAAEIEKRGGEEWIFGEFIGGRSIGEIMRELGFSRTYFYAWMKEGSEEQRAARAEAYHQAKILSAEAHVEQAGEILDDLAEQGGVTPAEVQIAIARSKFRQWLAGKRDGQYSDQKGAGMSLTINVGQLHLDALRQAGRMSGAAAIEVLDAELIEAGE